MVCSFALTFLYLGEEHESWLVDELFMRYFCSEFLAQFTEGRAFIPNFFLFGIDGLTFQLSILLIAVVRSRCICFQRLLNVSLWLERPQ